MSRQQALDTLDPDGDASMDDVEAAYRERVKETHLDSKTDNEEVLKHVNHAHEHLTE